MKKFSLPKKIKKRDGRIADFDPRRISNAVFKAFEATGNPDRKAADELASSAVEKIRQLHRPSSKTIPSIEEVQDIVEEVLIEHGYAKIAKAFILYREKRAEIRREKQKILDKEEIDEVDKRFDLNALRVLRSRYLRRDDEGKVIESPKELFTRVALHVALPDILYSNAVSRKKRTSSKEIELEEPLSKEKIRSLEGELLVGKYQFNRFHVEALNRLFLRFQKEGRTKINWQKLVGMLKRNQFKHIEETVNSFYDLMVSRRFMPNTPALANFGNYLGMGSACFHPSQLIITNKGPKKIVDIGAGDQVLTHKNRFKPVIGTFVREVDEEIYKIKVHKLPRETLLVTREHPVLIYAENKLVWKRVSELKERDFAALSYPDSINDVKKIKVSDYVNGLKVKANFVSYVYRGGNFNAFQHTTKTIKNRIVVDKDLMTLFGFYLSEGCVSGSDCVCFTFSVNERDLVDEVIRIMEEKFGVSARIEATNRSDRNWLSLRFHSVILAKFFEALLGTGFDKKIIPDWMLTLPHDKQIGILKGMMRGDGTLFRNGKHYQARTVMCNFNLVYGFWQICLRLNIFPSLGIAPIPKLGRKNPVICTIGNDGSHLFEDFFGKHFPAPAMSAYLKNPSYLRLSDGVLLSRIMKIEKIKYKGPVYNLEVEEDHSYSANGVSVHNCFVLDVEDSIESIMDTLKNASIIFKAGGGLGYNFSKLRPEGDYVKTTGGVASGPLSFMRLFDTMTEVIKQGGIRRGANMGILNSNHPDVEKFITSKSGNKALRNFNISVLIMPDFWDYYKKDKPYPLVNPRTGKVARFVSPALLFDRIVYQAWESAEPGVIFHDHVNKYNPFFEDLGPIVCTNPCGEVLLYPNESCNLGSLNVWAFVSTDSKGRKIINWGAFERAIRLAARFLDNIIDINIFPLEAIEEMTLNTRKIGLGIMGLGDLLYDMEIPFNTQRGRNFMEKIAEFVNYYSKCESVEIAKERGSFPFFKKSFYPEGKVPFSGFYDKKSWHFDWSRLVKDIKKYGIRNGYTTVIAPTGSISMIAGCSSGIEPVYSLVFEKNVAVGSFYYVDPVFERAMMREGLFDEALIKDIARYGGTVQRVPYIPPRLKKIFVSAHDIVPEDHIRTLAVFQKWVDSSISKTNNFPRDATVEYMRKSYLLAYELGCKDVTVYRDTSIQNQVLVSGETPKKSKASDSSGSGGEELVRLKDEKAEGMAIYKNPAVADDAASRKLLSNGILTKCPNCGIQLSFKEGCASCPACGWGLCS